MSVIDGSFETKGTHLFFVDNQTNPSEPSVTQMTCPTGINGINGGSKDRINVTCLSETGPYRKYVGGFADAQEVAVPFILKKADGSHKALFALQAANSVVSWLVGLSDSEAVPTLSTDELLVAPEDRTTFEFQGYVANLTIDMETNEVVRGTLTIQPSGSTTPNWAD